MGCFSFLCKESGKAVLSNSFDGSPVHMFLLKNGKVVEHMYGNYNSYGAVFTKDHESSFEWKEDWENVCDLMFNGNDGDGICCILEKKYNGKFPTKVSESDENQGWGDGSFDIDNVRFKKVKDPFHRVY